MIFFAGILIGLVIAKGFDFGVYSASKQSEIAIGEMLYEELKNYPEDQNIRAITSTMLQLSEGKRTIQDKESRDHLLLELGAKKAEVLAQENLRVGEQFLAELSISSNVQPIKEGKVYIEILQMGTGDIVQEEDVVYLFYKQYGVNGNLVKDTKDKSFPIPLSKMIKGFKLGIKGARVGERRRIYIHPDYGFGKVGRGEEANQLLIYEVQIDKILR